MRPGPGDQVPIGQVFDGAERVVAIPVGPATDQQHGARHPLVPIAARAQSDRTAPPGRIRPRVAQRTSAPWIARSRLAQPLEQPRLVLVDAPLPLGFPIAAEPGTRPHRRRGRQRVHRDHVERVVDEVDRAQHTAHVVHVVGVAVVGGVHRCDRTQLRDAFHRHVQRVEPRVRGAEHAHLAGAPWLSSDPLDDGAQVAPLDVGVLVLGDSSGVAGAPNVDAQHCEAAFAGEAQVAVGVRCTDVAHAVRQGLEQSRERALCVGQVQRAGQHGAALDGDGDELL